MMEFRGLLPQKLQQDSDIGIIQPRGFAVRVRGKDQIAEQHQIVAQIERGDGLVNQQSLVIAPHIIEFASHLDFRACHQVAGDDFAERLQSVARFNPMETGDELPALTVDFKAEDLEIAEAVPLGRCFLSIGFFCQHPWSLPSLLSFASGENFPRQI